jgi:hypothetical protein
MNHKQQSALFDLLFISARYWIKDADQLRMPIKKLHECMSELCEKYAQPKKSEIESVFGMRVIMPKNAQDLNQNIISWFEMYNYWNSLEMPKE